MNGKGRTRLVRRMLVLYHSRAAQLRAMEYWSHEIGFQPLGSLRATAEPGARRRPLSSVVMPQHRTSLRKCHQLGMLVK